jgi:mono/diheme cytochrome c family protein
MRTNLTGFALTVGMGLIVILMGFGLLSAAGLAGFSASDTFAEQNALVEKGKNVATADSVGGVAMPVSSNAAIPGDAIAIANGDALFKNNCAQCHAVNEKVVGPALAGITKRRSLSWLVPWVQNSAKVVASGDEYAVKIYNDNGKQQMPSFALSKKEIQDIIAWIDSQQGTTVTSAPLVAVN